MENLYTYSDVAKILGLAGRSSTKRRLVSLAKRGKPLTAKGGELRQVGERWFITEAGLRRLREFEPLPAGAPRQIARTGVHQLVTITP